MKAYDAQLVQADAVSRYILDGFASGSIGRYVDPFQKVFPSLGGQYNPTTGKYYQAGNQMFLSAVAFKRGVADNRWMTFHQTQEAGFKVRKGAKSVPIVFYQKITTDELDAKGNPIEKRTLRYYNVFNGSDIEGLPPEARRQIRPQHQLHDECERIIKESGVAIRHVEGSSAYYHPIDDEVVLPLVSQFHSMEQYYAVAMHELGHATGHASRLNRDMTGQFGTESYAKEELRAEIASLMGCQRLGIAYDLGNHMSYLKSWATILTEKPTEILKACSDAERICDHLGIHAQELVPLPKKEQSLEDKERIEQAKQTMTVMLEQSYSQKRKLEQGY